MIVVSSLSGSKPKTCQEFVKNTSRTCQEHVENLSRTCQELAVPYCWPRDSYYRDIVTLEFPKGKKTYKAGDDFAPPTSESKSIFGIG